MKKHLCLDAVTREAVAVGLNKIDEQYIAHASRIQESFTQLRDLLDGIVDKNSVGYNRVRGVVQKQFAETYLLEESL